MRLTARVNSEEDKAGRRTAVMKKDYGQKLCVNPLIAALTSHSYETDLSDGRIIASC